MDVILPIDELHHFSRWLLHHQPVSWWMMLDDVGWDRQTRRSWHTRRILPSGSGTLPVVPNQGHSHQKVPTKLDIRCCKSHQKSITAHNYKSQPAYPLFNIAIFQWPISLGLLNTIWFQSQLASRGSSGGHVGQESGLPLSYDPEILREYFDGLPGLQLQRRRRTGARCGWERWRMDLCLGSLFWDGRFMMEMDRSYRSAIVCWWMYQYVSFGSRSSIFNFFWIWGDMRLLWKRILSRHIFHIWVHPLCFSRRFAPRKSWEPRHKPFILVWLGNRVPKKHAVLHSLCFY